MKVSYDTSLPDEVKKYTVITVLTALGVGILYVVFGL